MARCGDCQFWKQGVNWSTGVCAQSPDVVESIYGPVGSHLQKFIECWCSDFVPNKNSDGFRCVSGLAHFVTLPSNSNIIGMRIDGDDLIAETAAGESFRIDTDRRVIRVN